MTANPCFHQLIDLCPVATRQKYDRVMITASPGNWLSPMSSKWDHPRPTQNWAVRVSNSFLYTNKNFHGFGPLPALSRKVKTNGASHGLLPHLIQPAHLHVALWPAPNAAPDVAPFVWHYVLTAHNQSPKNRCLFHCLNPPLSAKGWNLHGDNDKKNASEMSLDAVMVPSHLHFSGIRMEQDQDQDLNPCLRA